jgi:Queuine tRNA-ribosyltransferase
MSLHRLTASSPPFLTPDLLQVMHEGTGALTAMHLLAHDMKATDPPVEQSPCALRTAVCLPHFTVTVMSSRPLLGNPLQKATANAVLAETLKGWQSLTPAEYMAIAAATRPAIVFALHSDLLHTASAKRHARCHQRNMAWLTTCLQSAAETGLAVFGAAHGGSDAACRRSAASEVAACNVAGMSCTSCICDNHLISCCQLECYRMRNCFSQHIEILARHSADLCTNVFTAFDTLQGLL